MALIVKVFSHNFLFLKHFRQSTKIDSYHMEESQSSSIIYSTHKLVHDFSHLHVLAIKEIELKKPKKWWLGIALGVLLIECWSIVWRFTYTKPSFPWSFAWKAYFKSYFWTNFKIKAITTWKTSTIKWNNMTFFFSKWKPHFNLIEQVVEFSVSYTII